jgi:membrane fusion protein (multidrug efflux system)
VRRLIFLVALLLAACNHPLESGVQASKPQPAAAPVEVVRVLSAPLATSERLPAELAPWEAVAVYPKVAGFVAEIAVDRGSVVGRGQLLVRLSAPELIAQAAQAAATLEGDRSTFERLRNASATQGAVSENELELARQALAADQQRLRSLRTLAGYLVVSAPFDGIITERNVHPGALVGPPAEPLTQAVPMLRMEQIATLRLTVPVPEGDTAGIAEGANVQFQVRAWPGESFVGRISRVSHAVDVRTRTMAVEADVDNRRHRLDPGMFAEVLWPVRRSTRSLFVPAGAIVETTQAIFVQRVRNGKIERVNVQRGKPMGDLVEVFGQLRPQDLVAARGSEDLADGAPVIAKTGGRNQP